MAKQLIPAMVHGGMGIQGIADTPFYKFVSSQEGLSQLGIRPEDPPKLLTAYLQTFKTKRAGNTLTLAFGDERLLKSATPHFASGRGRLKVKSWLEWIVDNRTEQGFGFVTRNAIPKGFQQHIRLAAPLGGLMLPRGILRSAGFWQFPSGLMDYEITWFKQNELAIRRSIEAALMKILRRRFRSR